MQAGERELPKGQGRGWTLRSGGRIEREHCRLNHRIVLISGIVKSNECGLALSLGHIAHTNRQSHKQTQSLDIDTDRQQTDNRDRLDDSQIARDKLPEAGVGEHNAVQVRAVQLWRANRDRGDGSIRR